MNINMNINMNVLKKMMINPKSMALLTGALLMTTAITPAWSAIRPQLTRVIAYAADRETQVDIVNDSKDTYMVQSWLEDLNGKDSGLPLVLTPPVMKLEGGKKGKLRLVVMRGEIPQGRESAYWLSLQEIPPKPKDNENRLVIAIRSQIKVFVRPDGLDAKGSAEAPSKLTWRIEQSEGKRWLRATNPSAYYVSFGELAVGAAGSKGTRLEDKHRMVPPGGSERYALPAAVKGNRVSVTWSGMNDWGGAGKEHKAEAGL